jgi:hypothetical protein
VEVVAGVVVLIVVVVVDTKIERSLTEVKKSKIIKLENLNTDKVKHFKWETSLLKIIKDILRLKLNDK